MRQEIKYDVWFLQNNNTTSLRVHYACNFPKKLLTHRTPNANFYGNRQNKTGKYGSLKLGARACVFHKLSYII